MVYANVVNKPFGQMPADDADAEWIRQHKIKAFRAMTTGKYKTGPVYLVEEFFIISSCFNF